MHKFGPWPTRSIRTLANGDLVEGRCPICGSADIEGEGPEGPEGGVIWQAVTCHTCGSTWRDVYTLTQQEIGD